eukprot:6484401-Amphidinium_carterae.1
MASHCNAHFPFIPVMSLATVKVESMGAEFVKISAKGIQGEGSGGYATDCYPVCACPDQEMDVDVNQIVAGAC